MQDSKNLLPLTLVRPSSTILCGGYSFDGLYLDFFGKKNDQDCFVNAVPSIPNMQKIEKGHTDLDLFLYPWDVILYNKKILQQNLLYKISKNSYKEISENVFVGVDVKIEDPVVFKTDKDSIIVIDNYSQISPYAYLEAPLYIGKHSKLIEHCSIKHSSCIGDWSKVGGEVESSIVSNYSNKQHFGYIGNSYIGEWVNLGAGTTNSDLKNTYGEISIDYQSQKIKTGSIFLGAMISDYVKTAINTSIYTGKIIGLNSHLYGVVKENIPSFINYTGHNNQEFMIDQAVLIQERMFKRRGVIQRSEDVDMLKGAFLFTQKERDLFLTNFNENK